MLSKVQAKERKELSDLGVVFLTLLNGSLTYLYIHLRYVVEILAQKMLSSSSSSSGSLTHSGLSAAWILLSLKVILSGFGIEKQLKGTGGKKCFHPLFPFIRAELMIIAMMMMMRTDSKVNPSKEKKPKNNTFLLLMLHVKRITLVWTTTNTGRTENGDGKGWIQIRDKLNEHILTLFSIFFARNWAWRISFIIIVHERAFFAKAWIPQSIDPRLIGGWCRLRPELLGTKEE